MPPADAGSGLIFVENEGLTALATIMPPTVVGSEIPLAFRLRAFRRYAETGWLANSRFVDDWLMMPTRMKTHFTPLSQNNLPVPELSDTGRK